VLLAAVVACGAGAYLARGLYAKLLTKREWIVLGKLVGIAVFLFLLLLVKLSRELPSEMFIYGRF
jgi:hypothetical protein